MSVRWTRASSSVVRWALGLGLALAQATSVTACATATSGASDGDGGANVDAAGHVGDAGPSADAFVVTSDPFACDPGSSFGVPQVAPGLVASATGATLSANLLVLYYTNGVDLYRTQRNTASEQFGAGGILLDNVLWDGAVATDGVGEMVAFAGRDAANAPGTVYLGMRELLSIGQRASWTTLVAPPPLAAKHLVGFSGPGRVYVLAGSGGTTQLQRFDVGREGLAVTAQTVQGDTAIATAVISADELSLYYKDASGSLKRATRTSRDGVFVQGVTVDLPVDGGGLTWQPLWVSPLGCGVLLRRLGGGSPELYYIVKPA